MTERRKCKLLRISELELTKIIRKYCKKIDLPNDAEIAGTNYEPITGSWLIRINSSEYPNINRFEDIPIIIQKEKGE